MYSHTRLILTFVCVCVQVCVFVSLKYVCVDCVGNSLMSLMRIGWYFISKLFPLSRKSSVSHETEIKGARSHYHCGSFFI